ncbi:efflux RND transporter periplasmic adaptor subunit [Stieleria mannarensis]|uniref:efflux RND transporter periplasmic adaptor subunit n=1 Tax=Stieleria mannarensis TaxID=2755585 RepID=UPI0015FF7098|nr:efflux RND transporter periplasmic adaptor subunit [Rhodopirellula sp. JC639]
MTDAPNSHPKPNPFQLISQGIPTLLVLVVMAGGWLAIYQINHQRPMEVEPEVVQADADPETVVMPAGKLAVAQLKTLPVQQQSIQHVHTVPGRLRYDQTRHVDVKAPLDGIVSELLVTPGDQVSQGQLIAVLRSPEIGQARAEILKRQKERQIARQVLQREATLAKNLEGLSSMLDRGEAVDVIEAAFADQSLGGYRQQILSSYSKMKLAETLIAKIEPLVESGSVSGRTIREREAERQLAETAFRTARDQANFAAEQAKLKSEAGLAEADRQLNLAWQAVETLLGYNEDKQRANLSDEEALSRLEVRAPFEGTVESRLYADNERVSRGEPLIVLANTDSLYVEANIRESDWSAVSLRPGTPVFVRVPALENQTFDATVHYVGRQVQTDTNSVPLVATINNPDGLLRPGMFVRVTIPIGHPRQALSVKPESVVQHDNQQFVFVDQNGGAFKRVDVTTGDVSDDWVEITEGLSAGQSVVTDGAFLLKSELLLQGE